MKELLPNITDLHSEADRFVKPESIFSSVLVSSWNFRFYCSFEAAQRFLKVPRVSVVAQSCLISVRLFLQYFC